MCCGSPLPRAVKQGVIDRIGARLIELYGLTEGVITTLAPEDLAGKLDSVGKPLPGTDLRIIDDQGRELPRGQSGEIVGYGRILMSGYHERDDANAECTWLDESGRRWLRTGDIGRLDAEGFLYVVDRAKDMIISGGQNIYPADIEAVLVTHHKVVEAAVIGVASERWGESPLAIVVATPGTTQAEAAEIRAWTNARVGRQQRLSGVILRQNLPRNANGKILKRELRREYRDAPATP
jgi:acyl-CoA synthetase (AMP-forming)/AMP-acid ligase II